MKSYTSRLPFSKAIFHISKRNSRNPGDDHPISWQAFRRLPTEIVLQIASHLPIYSAAALALCNQDLFGILRRPYITDLPRLTKEEEADVYSEYARGLYFTKLQEEAAAKTSQRDLLVKTLSKDFLDAFFCSRCKKLHFLFRDTQTRRKMSAKKRFNTVVERSHGCWGIYRDPTTLGTHVLKHLEVATKLLRNSLDHTVKYLECAAITSSKPTGPEIKPLSLENWGFEFWEARLIGGRIFTRTQSWVLMDEILSRFRLSGSLHITACCEHMHPRKARDDDLGRVLTHKLLDFRLGEYPGSCYTEVLRCRRCETEVDVEIKKVNSHRNTHALIVTKWNYLEAGSLSTQKVPKELPERQRFTINPAFNRTPGNIRNVFEKHARTPFSSICSVEQAWEVMTKRLS